MVALTGEQNHRRPTIGPVCLAEQFQARSFAKPVIDEINVMLVPVQDLQSGFVTIDPVKPVRTSGNGGKQVACDDIIILVIINQQDSDQIAAHRRNQLPSGGSSTTSNQYRPRTFMISTRALNVTGLVT